ncbi:MAG: 5'/3'-nucleotidase SurE [SAR202 cluster bacterium]|nr:5'/3'-nucleotidase SurE [SAR202 cluster bacterium]MQG36019.1 5'/3'-nucleotidase SurE [SAR202 cluster bacterium]MQG87043.1 5'/3'-nucleotidase SurE [SAR202 cluster bacterium]|tara:strand:+ start:51228 stop:52040 length:813 start_codon:yes stop_codon:yes gene_type:complete
MAKTLLITNDDGIEAPGIWSLVNSLTPYFNITVSAPATDHSGASSSVSIRKSVHTKQIDPSPFLTSKPKYNVSAYCSEGTPGDSCIIGIECIHDNAGIDLVVSGINKGANVGSDTIVSGTVGAAIQGYVRSIPSIAISIASIEEPIFETAATYASQMCRQLLSESSIPNVLLNINVPSLPINEIKGAQVTKLGGRSWAESIKASNTTEGTSYYFTRDQKLFENAYPGTDLFAIDNQYISVTPLTPDLSLTNEQSVTFSQQLINALSTNTT